MMLKTFVEGNKDADLRHGVSSDSISTETRIVQQATVPLQQLPILSMPQLREYSETTRLIVLLVQ